MTNCQNTASRIIEETVAIQQIAAPTFFEKERSEYIFKRFKEKGLSRVVRDKLNNVYGRIEGGDKPPVVVSAHLDTVFEKDTDLGIKHEDDRIYGPGIGDNSLGVATLVGIKDLVDAFPEKPAGDIIIVANVCEEGIGDLAGIKGAMETLLPESPAAFLVLEGMGLGRIYVEGVGSKRYKITARAKGGHSWNDFGEGSAVHALVRLAAELTELKPSKNPKASFNIGVIQGGRSINTIAESAHLLLDLRSGCETALASLVSQAETIIAGFSMEKASISHEIIGDRPAGHIEKDSRLVKLCEAIYRAEGIEDLELVAGSTDANIPFSMKIPAVCIGLTKGENAHRENEYIETLPFAKGLAILSGILEGIWEILED